MTAETRQASHVELKELQGSVGALSSPKATANVFEGVI